MPLIFNGNSIPGNGAVIENGVSLSSLKANNVEVWKRQKTVYVTYAASDIFTINAENGNYYLMLEVASGATGGGLHATIQMNGCYLI